ncbi:DUF7619 domain-containing protein [Flavobacterium terrisoli]|uniref:DUF7619 domain-containing protein n=1 Tax=Flavobacterium terrisoli TaxID=3242195 RepID=UPI002542999E|nr:T9SS type A sorting domain-containing protein [Flavobacterium buctense]
MKKLYALLVLLFTAVTTNAQIINIPDANFKAKLLAASPTADIAWGINGKIKVDTNDDGEIQESEALLVIELNLSSSNISDLTGLEFFSNMDYLVANNNQLTSFPFNGALPNLSWLNLSSNNLTTLSLSNFNSLWFLALAGNQISSLNLSTPHLHELHCNSNNLTSIDLTECIWLEFIGLSNNQLTSIVFPAYPSPNTPTEPSVYLNGNLFETIELPNHYFGGGNYSNNPNLKYFNLKEASHGEQQSTGSDFYSTFPFANCPALEYVCVRDRDISAAQNMINSYGYTNCHVNSYCTFTPGGTYYTLQGTNTFDVNSNGCDSGDILVPNVAYTISLGLTNSTLVAGNDGLFHYDVSAGNYTITPILQNPGNYTITPATATVSFPSAGASFTQNFCITPNAVHHDLEVSLLPIGPARPGFDAQYKIIYKNKGTTIQSGTINFSYDDTILQLVSTNPTISGQGTDSLNWSFTNLSPFETREITIILNLNSPLETPPVNAGNWLLFDATAAGATDETPNDNASTLTQTVVNSFDPNDKTCIEGTWLPIHRVGEYVHYVIRFENTGTFAAENIVVKDVIDTAKFDIATLVPLNGSHSFYTKITNTNHVEFIFENIDLPFDDVNNDGYVAFKIKTKSTLVEGNTFSNAANIYFDYNAPIVTDTYTTTVFNPLSSTDFEFSSVFSLSPVPTKDVLTITAKETVIISSVNIYNTLGQLVQVNTNPREPIDVSGLQSGSYFIKIISDKGSATGKFIKE